MQLGKETFEMYVYKWTSELCFSIF